MKLMFNQVRTFVRVHWQMILAIGAGTFVVCFMMLFRLGSISGGLSTEEVRQAEFSSSWRHIANNPLNLPLTLTQWLILSVIPHHGNTVTRAASPILGVLAVAAFAYVLRRWYGVRTAVYGTLLFGFCSWFLHVSRYASTEVLYLWAIPTLLAILIVWDRHKGSQRASLAAFAILAVLLYVPGMIWLLIVALIFHKHLIKHGWQSAKSLLGQVSLVLTPVILLVPLIGAMLRNPSLVQTWLGLPHTFGTPESIVRGLIHCISFFIYKGPDNPEIWLVRVSILGFFGIVMAALGVLFYLKHFKALRTRLLIALYALGAILFAIGGPVALSVLVPLVYLVIAAGLGYLLHEWLQVFPRNPLARSIGIGLMAVVVALNCLYHVRAYYIAWPHNHATQAAFHKHP